MKTEKAIQVLRDFNLWRRADEDMEQPDPREIGKAIDAAIEAMEELNEWKTLSGWGGTPEIIDDFIKGQQSRIYAAQEAEEQRDEAREYADKLAEGLPDGMLPKDVEVLREANLGLATEVATITEQRDRLAEAIRKHRDELKLTSGDSVDRILWNTLAAVKGGSDE